MRQPTRSCLRRCSRDVGKIPTAIRVSNCARKFAREPSFVTPDISEFSYGFALTQELIALAGEPLRAAPIFPSLIEEGRPGGGYDVNLDIPGFPLFLQFKRSDCMVSSRAKEIQQGCNFSLPFYRLKITERSRSAQHDMLLELDDGRSEVFYAAPRFHTVKELNAAYLAAAVSNRSFYIRPRDIGRLDDDAHHIAFDETTFRLCSEPREVKGIRGDAFPAVLRERRIADDRPLRSGPLDDVLSHVERLLHDRSLPTDIADRVSPVEDDELRKLRRLADISLRYFGTQLFIVQDAPAAGGT